MTFGVLGAFYGLVLAFVIVAAWERFNQANTDALQEATALESSPLGLLRMAVDRGRSDCRNLIHHNAGQTQAV